MEGDATYTASLLAASGRSQELKCHVLPTLAHAALVDWLWRKTRETMGRDGGAHQVAGKSEEETRSRAGQCCTEQVRE